MHVHLLDGTYELFRCHFGAPSRKTSKGKEVGATRGLLRSLNAWLKTGEATHVASAFDTVIESFRNDLFDGYKTGEGVEPELMAQFPLAERAAEAMGVVVWRMKEFEADDALATGGKLYGASAKVKKVFLCSPDKDLAQCIGGKVFGFDRFKKVEMNEEGVVAKYGVPPKSIPDLLALVGDTADGIPGISKWGMKSAATVLAAYGNLEKIPKDPKAWKIPVRGADSLAANLAAEREEAILYKKLATLRFDVPLKESLSDLEWKGADKKKLEKLCVEIEDDSFLERVERFK